MSYKIEMKGKKFGKLIVIEYAGQKSRRRTMWKCICDCGNIVVVDGTHLRDGHTKSCGCLSIERISKLNYKNGLSNTKLQYTYNNMKNRCYRVKGRNYNNYGGRGIKLCDEWNGKDGFENFCRWACESGYKDGLTLDRMDNNMGYSPNNCRWVDRYTQGNNKRNNRFVKINGEIGTVANMARKYNVGYWNLIRYSKGGKNAKYPDLKIEVVSNEELQEYRTNQINRQKQ